MKSFLGNFYRHFAIFIDILQFFSGHTALDHHHHHGHKSSYVLRSAFFTRRIRKTNFPTFYNFLQLLKYLLRRMFLFVQKEEGGISIIIHIFLSSNRNEYGTCFASFFRRLFNLINRTAQAVWPDFVKFCELG